MILLKHISFAALLSYLLIGHIINNNSVNPASKEKMTDDVTCEEIILRQLIQKNILLYCFSSHMSKSSQSPAVRMIAKNIYDEHLDLQMEFRTIADQNSFTLPTLPNEDDTAYFSEVKFKNSKELDESYIAFAADCKKEMKELMTLLMQCKPSANSCQLINHIYYIDVLRAEGLENMIED